MKDALRKNLMDYALWLLSRRDMSEFEILKKLHLKAAKADAFSEEEKEDAMMAGQGPPEKRKKGQDGRSVPANVVEQAG